MKVSSTILPLQFPYLSLLALPLAEPLHLGRGFTLDVDVEEDGLARAHRQRLQVGAVDAGLHWRWEKKDFM